MREGSIKRKPDRKTKTKKLLSEKISRLAASSHLQNLKEDSRVVRIDVPVSDADGLSWLSAQRGAGKFYWRDREKNFEIAAIGLVDVVTSDDLIDYEAVFKSLQQKISSADPEVRYYGGLRFSDHRAADETWRAYGSYRFFLPRFELCMNGGKGYLACNVVLSKGSEFSASPILAELDAMIFPVPGKTAEIPRLIGRNDIPERATWGQNIERALSLLNEGPLKKIVLARKSSLEFDAGLDPFILLRSLEAKTNACFHFCFAPGQQTAFIGASPERLYARDGRSLKTEALAGTRPRGNSKQSDDRLSYELLQSEKDMREQAFVVDGIREALLPLCRTLEAEDRIQLLRLARSQHLICAIQAELNHGITDARILDRLHPTPAVGGYPTANALAEIARLESFDRGWYAGPLGWIGRDRAEFCVAIRSGLVENSRLHLFAGAGIVEGSTAEGEWDEIENKISDFIKILAGS